MRKLLSWIRLWFVLGLCASFAWGCFGGGVPNVESQESAEALLRDRVVPNINLEENFITDAIASRYATDSIVEPLPNIEDFPVYGASPSAAGNAFYLEIYSSSEKANADRQNERWLVEVADAFNQQGLTTPSGQTIQVGIRKIPSGTAARLIAAGQVQPAGYSPSNDLWVELLKSEGITPSVVVPRLVPNTAGFVLQDAAYQQLANGSQVSFEQILDGVVSGQLSVGYPNPYTSSTSLNLLYHLFWRASGQQEADQALTVADLELPQVNSVFSTFQEQVLITTTTTLDLQDIFIRDPDKLQGFPLEYQNYLNLRQISGFETVQFVPFGIPHNNPLVGFDWNDSETAAALQQFGEFAASDAMQQLAANQGFEPTDYLNQTDLPPVPSGEVLTAAQSYWKERKDGGRTVYLMTVVDTSGSMDGEPLAAVKTGLQVASSVINAGNQVGLVTFGDRPQYLVPLASFDQLQHQRLLAAIDSLQADGSTAMYDAVMIGLNELIQKRQADPDGLFYLMLLTDGEANRGYGFSDVRGILEYSDIRIYPIAYGDVNEAELQEIAQLRESTVKEGNPENVQDLLKGIFQTNL